MAWDGTRSVIKRDIEVEDTELVYADVRLWFEG